MIGRGLVLRSQPSAFSATSLALPPSLLNLSNGFLHYNAFPCFCLRELIFLVTCIQRITRSIKLSAYKIRPPLPPASEPTPSSSSCDAPAIWWPQSDIRATFVHLPLLHIKKKKATKFRGPNIRSASESLPFRMAAHASVYNSTFLALTIKQQFGETRPLPRSFHCDHGEPFKRGV